MANYVCEVALTDAPLIQRAHLTIAGAGAVVDFCGDVRSVENDAVIVGIEYEAHREMAQHQMEAIARDAAARFSLLAVLLLHRVGFVAAGKTSLFLRVAAARRGPAFSATEWIVEELKRRVPIWKTPVFQESVVDRESHPIAFNQ